MKTSKHYTYKYLENGDFYSATQDYRRMNSIDMHMRQYAQTVGNGIIEGWEIESLGGLSVRITPGIGLIDGLITETAWLKDVVTGEPKRKKQAILDADTILKDIPGWSDPRGISDIPWLGAFYKVAGGGPEDAYVFDKLGPEGEDLDHDNVVEGVLNLYLKNPSDSFYDNPYVKAIEANANVFLLDDDSEFFFLAKRVSEDPLETFAKFEHYPEDRSGNDSVLIARVITRNGTISKIDYASTRKLKGMMGTIAAMAKNYLIRHRHNGGRSFDPPALRLETDIRKARLSVIYSGGEVKYQVFGNKETSAINSHKHTYSIDEKGAGYTQEVIGDADFHYHLISNFAVSDSLKSYGSSLEPHTHEIGAEIDSWKKDTPIRVTVNGKIVTKGFTTDPEKQTITFDKGVVNIRNAVYKTSFAIDDKTTFELEEEAKSIKNFFLRIYREFNNRYRSQLQIYDENSKYSPEIRDPFTFHVVDGVDVEIGKESFVISDYTPVSIWPEGPPVNLKAVIIPADLLKPGGIYTTPMGQNSLSALGSDYQLRSFETYLEQQAAIAAARLVNPGDTFTLLPYLARYIPITLVSAPHIDDVVIEILENVEVQGSLRPESLLFIKAEKFSTGVFDEWLLPLIGHSGRIRETVEPESSNTSTDDGYSFFIVPTRTDASYGHAHLITTDRYGNGITTATTVNRAITVSKQVNGLPTRIAHSHSISSGVVSEVTNENINAWQEVSAETKHKHLIDIQISGDSKSTFSTIEDINGNLYFGTADGFMAKPINGGYSIFISDYEYQSTNSNVYEAAKEAFKRHSDVVGEFIEFVDDVEARLEYISVSSKTALSCQVYAYGPIFSGQRKDINGQKLPVSAKVEIEPKEIIKIDGFYKLSVKIEEDLLPDDEIIATYKMPKESSVSLAAMYEQMVSGQIGTDEETVDMFLVRNSYNKSTIWSLISLKDGTLVCCSNEGVYKSSKDRLEWSEISMPIGTGIVRKIFRDSNEDILAVTDSGLICLSKSFSFLKSRKLSDIDGEVDIYDSIEISPLKIMASTAEGIYTSLDNGNTWNSSLKDVEIIQFSKDHSENRTKETNGHIHYMMVDENGDGITTNAFNPDGTAFAGTQHIHSISSWSIGSCLGHIHNLQTSILALSKSKEIFKTIDDGSSWTKLADAPTDFGDIGCFSSGFGTAFIACEKGLAKWSGTEWELALTEKTRSLSWNCNLDSILVGTDNGIFSITESEVIEKVNLAGGPIPKVRIDGTEVNFGYSFNNYSNTIVFKEQQKSSSEIFATTAYDMWAVTGGGWDSNKDYEVFIDDKTVINTKEKIDRRSSMGYDFTVDSSNGYLNFSKITDLSSDILSGQVMINVSDASGLKTGDTIAVVKFPEEVDPETELEETEVVVAKQKASMGILVEKRKVISVVKNIVTVDKPFTSKIEMPAQVKRLLNIDENSKVLLSVYQTNLINIGKLTHESIEDELSLESAGSPFQLSNIHIADLSELTLAVKYAIPEIDSLYKNWKAYMMRFDHNPDEADYIDRYFNTEDSNLKSGISAETPFSPIQSAAINVVTPGQRTYSDLMFVGTDAGLFVSKKEPDIPSNWFFVYDCPAGAVYDITFPGDDKIIVAGQNGVWSSNGGTLKAWSQLAQNIAKGTAYFARNRWVNFGIPGDYWWNSWGESENLIDPQITNTLLIGGQDFTMTSSDSGKSWLASALPMDLKLSDNKKMFNYKATHFVPLQSGKAILVANSVKKISSNDQPENRLFVTGGLGGSWDDLYSFVGQSGEIIGIKISTGGNTELNVKFSDGFGVQANILSGSYMTFGNKTYKISRNRNDIIVLYGEEPFDTIKTGDSFTIEAPLVTAITEDSQETLYVAAGSILFTDVKTGKSNDKKLGTVIEVNKSAMVDSIDSSGVISTVEVQSNITGENVTTKLNCILDRQASLNEFVGKQIIITGFLAPTVSFISPSPSETLTSSTVTVSLSVQSFDLGASGTVSIQLDSLPAVVGTSSVVVLEGVSTGSHVLKAQLLGADGKALTNQEALSVISFSTEFLTTVPSVSILSPTTNEVITSGSFKATFKVSNFITGKDGNLLYSIDGKEYLTVVPFGSGTTEVVIQNLSDGTHYLRAMLSDNSFRKVGEESVVSFSIASGGLPSIHMISPVQGMTIPYETLEIQYTVSNVTIPGTASVKVTLDGNQSYISTNESSYTLTSVKTGDHSLKLEILDGNLKPFTNSSASTFVTFKVDTSLSEIPTIYITSPVSSSQFAQSDYFDLIYFTSNFEIPLDGGVIIKVNNAAEVFTDTYAPFKIPGTPGDYVVTATLAKSATVKLTDPLATTTISFKIVSGTSVKSDIPEKSVSSPVVISTPVAVKNTTVLSKEETASLGDRRWNVISNSSSTISGLTTIRVSGAIPLEMKNQSFRVVGEKSIIYLSFDQNVAIGEFDKGFAYIDSEESNAYKTYSIVRQMADRIELDELIDPLKELKEDEVKHVASGQKIRLLPASGANTVWMDFVKKWGEDELCGTLVRAQGESAYSETEADAETTESNTQNSFIVIDNDENSITLNTASPYAIRKGEDIMLDSLVLLPVMSFCGKRLLVDSDHTHNSELIGSFLNGGILSISSVVPYVDVVVSKVEALSNHLIVANPSLLEGVKILLYNPSDPREFYRKEVFSIQGDVIRVKAGDLADWGLNQNSTGISNGWLWSIDARWYGITNEPSYDNFIKFQTRLSEDGIAGNNSVKVEDSSEISIGDMVEICNSSKTQILEVDDLLPGGEVVFLSELLDTYRISNGSYLRVRISSSLISSESSSNPNHHTHMIKDGEVYGASVEEYTHNGYPYSHTHELSGLIHDVKALSFEYDADRLVVAGNSPKIYASDDNGQTWKIMLDTENLLGDWNGSFISMNRSIEGDLFIGTNDGRFIGQGVPEQNTSIVYPGNSQLMPSSSSQSTSSSISSVSSSSSLSTEESRSSSTMQTYSTEISTSSTQELTSSSTSFGSSESTVVQGERI